MLLSEQIIRYLQVSLDCMKKQKKKTLELHDAIPQVERIIEMFKRENEQENS